MKYRTVSGDEYSGWKAFLLFILFGLWYILYYDVRHRTWSWRRRRGGQVEKKERLKYK